MQLDMEATSSQCNVGLHKYTHQVIHSTVRYFTNLLVFRPECDIGCPRFYYGWGWWEYQKGRIWRVLPAWICGWQHLRPTNVSGK